VLILVLIPVLMDYPL